MSLTCQREGCTAEAKFAPKICVPAQGHAIDAHQPIGVVVGVKCCPTHLYQFPVQDMIAIGAIRFALMSLCQSHGRAAPDFARAFVEPVALESAEFAQFEAMRAPRQ